MRIIFRKNGLFKPILFPLRRGFCTQGHVIPDEEGTQGVKLNSNHNRAELRKHDSNSNTEEMDYKQIRELERQELADSLKGNDQAEYILESSWPIATYHILQDDYQLMKQTNREQNAKEQITSYQKSRKLTIERNLFHKLFDEHDYFRKMGKYHLSELGPLADSFLRKGCNFMDKKVLLHMIKNQKINLLKKVMASGGFEDANYIDQEVLQAIFKAYRQNERNQFMINLLNHENELNLGIKPLNINPTISERLILASREQTIKKIIYKMQNSKDLNRLRFLWACQSFYLHQYHLYQSMITQLKKLKFVSKNKQKEVNKQVSYILGSAFSTEAMVDFHYKIFAMAKTYQSFIQIYSISILFLSKITAINQLLSKQNLTQLHQIFHLMELNLSQEIGQKLQTIWKQILMHPEHNWIYRHNYEQCIQLWRNDLNPIVTSFYHSPLTKILDQQDEELIVIYEGTQGVKQYAKSILRFSKKEKPNKNNAQQNTQAKVINDLLKGDYQSVFDDFQMRYALPADFDLNKKFQTTLQQVDKTKIFKNIQQQSLYKLKLASTFYFTQAYNQPLQLDWFNRFKQNITVASLIHQPLFQGQQLVKDELLDKLRAKKKQIEQYWCQEMGVGFIKSNNDKNTEKRDSKYLQKMKQEEEEEEEESSQDIQMPKIPSQYSASEIFHLEKIDPMVRQFQDILKDLQNSGIASRKQMSQLESMPLEKARTRALQIYQQYSDIMNVRGEVKRYEGWSEDSQLQELKKKQKERKLKGMALEEDGQLKMTKKAQKLWQQYKNTEQPRLLLLDLQDHQELQKYQPEQELSQPLFKKNSDKVKEKLDGDYGRYQSTFELNAMENIEEYFESEISTDIDKGRDDRAYIHAYDALLMTPTDAKYETIGGEKDNQIQEEEEEEDENGVLHDPEERKIFRQEFKPVQQIFAFASTTRFEDLEVARIILDHQQDIYSAIVKKPEQYEKFDYDSRDIKKSIENQDHNNKKNKESTDNGFFKKKKYNFCTTKQIGQQIQIETTFNLQKIEEYRYQPVSQQFLNEMKNQSHIPKIGDGIKIAKYLFLHSKRKEKKMIIGGHRQMNIQFASVVGTRAKDYAPYLVNTLYPYELEDSLYESMLQDQLYSYNRHEFKQILAHMIYFKTSFTNKMVELICQTCMLHKIGYTFVEVAQFIKNNDIMLTQAALETLTKTWHRFAIINEDLLPFVREYCKRVEIPFKTSFYQHFCASLVKNNNFEKLQALCISVLSEIKPKTFKISTSMKSNEVPALQKAWKQKQRSSYLQLYLELIQVIATNLQTKIPPFLLNLYVDYLKLSPEPNQKELGYGFICCSTNKLKFNTLLGYLQKKPALGTQFIYNCLMQSLLSNLRQLQQYCERVLDASVFINRLVLPSQTIMKTMIIFRRSNSTNSFSKFLEHCLRFQVDVSKNEEIKKEMFFILNNKIEDVSITGIFNLLDFIFSNKREEERVMYRHIKTTEEEKQKKLAEIQAKKSDNPSTSEEQMSLGFIGKEQLEVKNDEDTKNKVQKQKLSKKEVKKAKKQKSTKQKITKDMAGEMVAEMQSANVEAGRQKNSLGDDEQIIHLIKGQTKKHESSRRKGVQSFNQLYRASLQVMKNEQQKQQEVVGKKKRKN